MQAVKMTLKVMIVILLFSVMKSSKLPNLLLIFKTLFLQHQLEIDRKQQKLQQPQEKLLPAMKCTLLSHIILLCSTTLSKCLKQGISGSSQTATTACLRSLQSQCFTILLNQVGDSQLRMEELDLYRGTQHQGDHF